MEIVRSFSRCQSGANGRIPHGFSTETKRQVQARVRRSGHSPRSKSFLSLTDVLRWMRQTEQEADRVGLTMRGYNQGSRSRHIKCICLKRAVPRPNAPFQKDNPHPLCPPFRGADACWAKATKCQLDVLRLESRNASTQPPTCGDLLLVYQIYGSSACAPDSKQSIFASAGSLDKPRWLPVFTRVFS
jgi:hypothetical protein